MIESFLLHLSEENLISENDKVLLAVSGGVDSMVMLDLFLKANIPIGVAHINHNLRHLESDGDQELVRTVCKKNHLKFHFHIVEEGTLDKGNLQSRARKIRYDFLNKIAETYHYTHIATAHHKDDSIENMLIHMMRGTGLDGLKGIALKNKNIIRPLLAYDNTTIRQYAKDNTVDFREDSSNFTNKYLRNKIRNEILPLIYDTDHRAKEGFLTTQKNIENSHLLYKEMLDNLKTTILTYFESYTKVSLGAIIHYTNSSMLLYEVIWPYGFNFPQACLMIKNINKTGTKYHSKEFIASLDSGELWIKPIRKEIHEESQILILENLPQKIFFGHKTYFLEIKNVMDIQPLETNKLYLSKEKLPDKLVVRTRKSGDKIKPLGMNGQSQKIKDYLMSKKIPSFLKEKIPVLLANDTICAVLTLGISEDYKVKDETRRVLVISEI